MKSLYYYIEMVDLIVQTMLTSGDWGLGVGGMGWGVWGVGVGGGGGGNQSHKYVTMTDTILQNYNAFR